MIVYGEERRAPLRGADADARGRALALAVLLVALAAGALAPPARASDGRLAVWLVAPEGRLLLLYRDGREVARRFAPSPGSSAEGLAPDSVTEALVAWAGGRARLAFRDGVATSVFAKSTATGAKLPASALPPLPAGLAAWLDWSLVVGGAPTATVAGVEAQIDALLGGGGAAGAADVDAQVEAIVAEEQAALDEEGAGAAPTAATAETVERAITAGFSSDWTAQPTSTDATATSTRNVYVEYQGSWSREFERLLREYQGRGSLGSTLGQFSFDGALGSPALARNQWRGGLQASVDAATADDAADDTVNLGLTGSGERVLNERLSLLGSLGASWLLYRGGDGSTASYDSRQLDASVGARRVLGQSGELTASLVLQDLAYPDDPGAHYRRTGLQVGERGEEGRLAWDAAAALTGEGMDAGSVSLSSGTTADDHDEADLSATLTWTFDPRLAGDLRVAHATRDYGHPNATNFDQRQTTLAPGVAWTLGSGSSLNLGSTWSWLRNRDRDGDDGATGVVVDETLDDKDAWDLQLAATLQRGALQLVLGLTWDRTHYPRSGQASTDVNVDGRGHKLDVSLAWGFAPDWSFDLAATRDVDTYAARPDDDTVVRSLAGSLRRQF